MNRKYIIVVLAGLLVLTGCGGKKDTGPEEDGNTVVAKVNEGDYEMISPYRASPVRQKHGVHYREKDIVEIGRRLVEKSKEHYSTKNHKIAEGQVITESRYNDLMRFKSDANPNGLITKYESGLEIDGAKLENPIFLNDIYELNFHKDKEASKVDGISIALVLKRNQFTNSNTGATHSMSDEALFKIGQAMGLQLSAYLRSLEDMANVPIYIALYAQGSDMDQLPDNYLPGYFIGDAYSVDNSTTFKKNQEGWVMLSDNSATEVLPDVVAQFMQIKRKMVAFIGDESVNITGRAFTINGSVESIHMDVNVGTKTFLELYGTAQYLSQELASLDAFNVPIKANIKIYQNTRIVVTQKPGEKPVLEVLE